MSRIGVFPKWNRNSVNPTISTNRLNHWSMISGQFKDPVSHLFLAGAAVASWSLSQGVTGSDPFNDNIVEYWIVSNETNKDVRMYTCRIYF